MSDAPRWDALLPSLLTRLRERRITGMYGNNDPQDWSIRLAEGIDPLCVEAAETIARLRADVAQAQAALREAQSGREQFRIMLLAACKLIPNDVDKVELEANDEFPNR